MQHLTPQSVRISLKEKEEFSPQQSQKETISPGTEVERMQLGKVWCDFIRVDSFLSLCRSWLDSTAAHHVVTLNPEMVMQAQDNPAFAHAVNAADIRIPDGAGLVWAQWYIRSQFWSLLPSLAAFPFRQVERIPGVDLVEYLAGLSEEKGFGMYLLGGTQSQVSATAKMLHTQHPALAVHTSPDHTYTINGPRDILDHIRSMNPAVLLVAYGAPNQTLWIERHKHEFQSVRIAAGVGGAFAILSEERPRAPAWMRNLNLEWAWRLTLEPKRLPRIWKATVQFPVLIHKQKLAGK